MSGSLLLLWQAPPFIPQDPVTAAWLLLTTGGLLAALLGFIRQGQTLKLERQKREDAERKAQDDREASHANTVEQEVTRRLQLELDTHKAQVGTFKEYADGMAKLLEYARADLQASNAQLAGALQQLAESKELTVQVRAELRETSIHRVDCERRLAAVEEQQREALEARDAHIGALQAQLHRLQDLPAVDPSPGEGSPHGA